MLDCQEHTVGFFLGCYMSQDYSRVGTFLYSELASMISSLPAACIHGLYRLQWHCLCTENSCLHVCLYMRTRELHWWHWCHLVHRSHQQLCASMGHGL